LIPTNKETATLLLVPLIDPIPPTKAKTDVSYLNYLEPLLIDVDSVLLLALNLLSVYLVLTLDLQLDLEEELLLLL